MWESFASRRCFNTFNTFNSETLCFFVILIQLALHWFKTIYMKRTTECPSYWLSFLPGHPGKLKITIMSARLAQVSLKRIIDAAPCPLWIQCVEEGLFFLRVATLLFAYLAHEQRHSRRLSVPCHRPLHTSPLSPPHPIMSDFFPPHLPVPTGSRRTSGSTWRSY